MALGQVIVRQLELADRGEVLERWLAHHLAEVIADAVNSTGPSKNRAEARAVELILKLWSRRRALPEQVDPLGGYRDAIKTLGQLMPDSNPWRHFSQSDTYDDMLHDMFETLSKSVVFGLLLTQVSRTRPITEEESKGLEEEEKYLQSALEHWEQFIPPTQPRRKVSITFVDPETTTGVDFDKKPEQPSDPGNGDDTPNEQTALHTAILASLEHMQAELTKLLTRWRGKTPHEPETDEAPDGS